MKKLLIPGFCIIHFLALCWWTLPHSFTGYVQEHAGVDSFTARLLSALALEEYPVAKKLLFTYVDMTGSQQYWDFFAPHSSRWHQYLSVCATAKVNKVPEVIGCDGQPYFTNLAADFAEFKLFGSGRSRMYRLSENLVNRYDTDLVSRFASYQAVKAPSFVNLGKQAAVISHQFELHPELADLPHEGYRSDQVLLVLE